MKFKATEPAIGQPPVDIDIAQDLRAWPAARRSAATSSGDGTARGRPQLQLESSALELIGSILGLIPQFAADVKPMGIGAGRTSAACSSRGCSRAEASIARIGADRLTYEAGKTGQDRRLRPPRAGLGLPEQPRRWRDHADLQAAPRRADPRGDRRAGVGQTTSSR